VAKEARVKKSRLPVGKALVKTIREALRVGDKVLSPAWNFKVKSAKARKGRNPKTGETIQIPWVAKFPSNQLLVEETRPASMSTNLRRRRLRRLASRLLGPQTII